MRIILAACILFTAVPSARAAFADLGAGARAPGMGDVFTAVADDVYAIHYNPAGLARLKRPEVGTSYTRLFLGLSDKSDLSTSFLGYAYPLKGGSKGTLAASWHQFSLDASVYQEQIFSVAYANKLKRDWGPGDLYGGITAKYLRRSFGDFPESSNALDGIVATGQSDPVLSGPSSKGAMSADLGFLYELRKFYSVGLSMTNVNRPNVAFSSSDRDRVPIGTKLGLNYRSLVSNVGLEYFTQRGPAGKRDQKFSIAVERWLRQLLIGEFGLRGGLSIGNRDRRTITMGLSYRTKRVGVDYAFSLPINSIASTAGSHRIGFSIRFGSTRSPDESVLMILEAMRKLNKGEMPVVHALGIGLSQEQKAILKEHLALGRSHRDQARYQNALYHLGQALAVSPADTELLKEFGRLNWVAQQVHELKNYRSDPIEGAWHQGVLAYLKGDSEAAVERISYAFNLDTERRDLEGFLEQMERATGLKRPLTPQIPPPQRRIEQLSLWAANAVEAGEYDKAIMLSRTVLEIDAATIGAWENLGTAYFAMGDYEKSLTAWENAYSLEKSAVRRSVLEGHLKSLRRLLARSKKPSPVRRPSTTEARVRRSSPEKMQALYNAGVDHYASGELEKARDAFQKVLRGDPSYVPARKALKRVMEELSRR